MAITAGATLAFTEAVFSGAHSFGNVAPSGANTLMLVGVQEYDGVNDRVTGVTVGGQAATNIASINASPTFRVALWAYVAGTTNGSNLDVTVTTSSSADILGAVASYYGAKQTSNPEASASDTVAGASLQGTVTVATDQAWVVMFGGANGAIAASTGATQRVTDGVNAAIFDSNGGLGTGSRSMTFTGTSLLGEVIVSVAPAAEVVTLAQLVIRKA